MKIIASTALVALLSVPSLANAQGSARDQDQVGVAADSKSYTTGIRTTEDGQNFCGGSLITPKHVLTASQCSSLGIYRWVSVGSRYLNGTQEGERIRIVSIMSHPNFREAAPFGDDFVVLELERPSSYRPVKLAAADDSDFKEGEQVTLIGWGVPDGEGAQPYERRQLQLELWNQDKCVKTLAGRAPKSVVDDSMLCAQGKSGESACYGDSGTPLIKESSTGEDILIGIGSWSNDCGVVNSPSVFGRVSKVRSWIDSIANGTCST